MLISCLAIVSVSCAIATGDSQLSQRSLSAQLLDSVEIAIADTAWQRLETVRHDGCPWQGIDPDTATLAAYFACEAIGARRYRENGLRFFERFPNDPRRWQWLYMTVGDLQRYYSDYAQAARVTLQGKSWGMAIDTAAKNRAEKEWSRIYPAMRAAFMASTQTTDVQRGLLRYGEMINEIRDVFGALARGEQVTTIRYLMDQFLLEAKGPWSQTTNSLAPFFVNPLIRRYDSAAVQEFLAAVKVLPDTSLSNWSAVQAELFAKQTKTFVMRGVDLAGRTVDVAQFRGKVVVIDFWGTTCSSCIGAFPKLKVSYERYHKLGVEFIGVALDEEEQREQVKNLIVKHKIPWVQIFTGKSTNEYWSKYALSGLPKYFIVDRNGYLVESSLTLWQDVEKVLNTML